MFFEKKENPRAVQPAFADADVNDADLDDDDA